MCCACGVDSYLCVQRQGLQPGPVVGRRLQLHLRLRRRAQRKVHVLREVSDTRRVISRGSAGGGDGGGGGGGGSGGLIVWLPCAGVCTYNSLPPMCKVMNVLFSFGDWVQTPTLYNSKHWFTTSILQPLPQLITPQVSKNCQLTDSF